MSDKPNKMKEIHARLDISIREMTAAVTDTLEKFLAEMRKDGLTDRDCQSVGWRYAAAFTSCANISLRRSGHTHDVGDEFYDVSEIKRERNELLEIIEKIIDAWRAGDNLDALVEDAEFNVKEMLQYSENFGDELGVRMKRQVDRWIDAVGTAPPGLPPEDLSYMKEEPHPNPPKSRDR
jgi:hypothetical protein